MRKIGESAYLANQSRALEGHLFSVQHLLIYIFYLHLDYDYKSFFKESKEKN